MVISSIFCHDIAGDGGRRSQHDEDRHQFLIPVAKIDSRRQEESAEQNQFNKRGDEGRLYFFDRFSSLKACPNGDQCQWCGSGADAADGFVQECRKPQPGKNKEQGDKDAEENGIFENVQNGPAEFAG